jgi:5'-nucleotidase
MDATGNPDAPAMDVPAPDAEPDGGIEDAEAGMDVPAPDAEGMDAEPTDDGVPPRPVAMQVLSISDWHAQLDPLTPENVGGAAALSAYFQMERARNPNTLTLTAGDAFGASPPLSGYFNEEPAIIALNLMGLDADTFGNHNFDRGVAHLQQMIDLAEFDYVSSNLANLGANLMNVHSPYHIIEVDGVDVALIGITNPDAPDLSFPGALGTLTIEQPAVAATLAREAAERAGARVFIALTHLGADVGTSTATWRGPLIDFANAVSGFHIILGDHTDREVNAVINDQIVVENRSKGRTYARIELTVMSNDGAVVSSTVTLVSPLVANVTPDPAVVAALDPYRAQLSAQLDGVIGVATGIFVRGNNVERLAEVPIGDLVADAFRDRYGTQIALTNSGGIRTPLPSSYLPMDTMLRRTSPGYAMGPPYDLVLGDALAVLPFGNAVVTRTVTGMQLWAALENAVSALPGANGRFAQISGFRFTYRIDMPVGMRVVSVELDDGTPIANDSTPYTFATTDFVNVGGDGYTMFADGIGTTREIAADVLAEYIELQGTITPTTSGRITDVTP